MKLAAGKPHLLLIQRLRAVGIKVLQEEKSVAIKLQLRPMITHGIMLIFLLPRLTAQQLVTMTFLLVSPEIQDIARV